MIVEQKEKNDTKLAAKKIKAGGGRVSGWFWLSLAPKRHSSTGEEEGLLLITLKAKDKSGKKVQDFARKMQKAIGRTKALRGEVNLSPAGKLVFQTDRAYSPFKKCMKNIAENYQIPLLKSAVLKVGVDGPEEEVGEVLTAEEEREIRGIAALSSAELQELSTRSLRGLATMDSFIAKFDDLDSDILSADLVEKAGKITWKAGVQNMLSSPSHYTQLRNLVSAYNSTAEVADKITKLREMLDVINGWYESHASNLSSDRSIWLLEIRQEINLIISRLSGVNYIPSDDEFAWMQARVSEIQQGIKQKLDKKKAKPADAEAMIQQLALAQRIIDDYFNLGDEVGDDRNRADRISSLNALERYGAELAMRIHKELGGRLEPRLSNALHDSVMAEMEKIRREMAGDLSYNQLRAKAAQLRAYEVDLNRISSRGSEVFDAQVPGNIAASIQTLQNEIHKVEEALHLKAISASEESLRETHGLLDQTAERVESRANLIYSVDHLLQLLLSEGSIQSSSAGLDRVVASEDQDDHQHMLKQLASDLERDLINPANFRNTQQIGRINERRALINAALAKNPGPEETAILQKLLRSLELATDNLDDLDHTHTIEQRPEDFMNNELAWHRLVQKDLSQLRRERIYTLKGKAHTELNKSQRFAKAYQLSQKIQSTERLIRQHRDDRRDRYIEIVNAQVSHYSAKVATLTAEVHTAQNDFDSKAQDSKDAQRDLLAIQEQALPAQALAVKTLYAELENRKGELMTIANDLAELEIHELDLDGIDGLELDELLARLDVAVDISEDDMAKSLETTQKIQEYRRLLLVIQDDKNQLAEKSAELDAATKQLLDAGVDPLCHDLEAGQTALAQSRADEQESRTELAKARVELKKTEEKREVAEQRKSRQAALDLIKRRCRDATQEVRDANGVISEQPLPGSCKDSVELLHKMNNLVGGCESIQDLTKKVEQYYQLKGGAELKAELQERVTELQQTESQAAVTLAAMPDIDKAALRAQLAEARAQDEQEVAQELVQSLLNADTVEHDKRHLEVLIVQAQELIERGRVTLRIAGTKWFNSGVKKTVIPLIKDIVRKLCELSIQRVEFSFKDAMKLSGNQNMEADLQKHPDELAYAWDGLPEGLQPERLQAQREAYYSYLDSFQDIDQRREVGGRKNRRQVLLDELKKRTTPKDENVAWTDFEDDFRESVLNGNSQALTERFNAALESWEGFHEKGLEGGTETGFAIADLEQIFSAWGGGDAIPEDLQDKEKYTQWLWGSGSDDSPGQQNTTSVVQALGALTMLTKVVNGGLEQKEMRDVRADVRAVRTEGADPETEALIAMLTAEIQKSLLELTNNGVDALKCVLKAIPCFGPVVGATFDVKDMLVAFAKISVDMEKAEKDRATAMRAFDTGDMMAYAVEGSAEYDEQRVARNSAEAFSKGLSALGGFVQGVPEPTAQVVGKLCKGLGDSISAISKLVAIGVDERTVAKIKALRKRANRGDAEAQNELFRWSQKHAKGLIAIGIQEGNPAAIRFAKTRTSSQMKEGEMRKIGLELCREWLLAEDRQEYFDQESAFSGAYRMIYGDIHKKWTSKTLKWKMEQYCISLERHGDQLRELSALWDIKNKRGLLDLPKTEINLDRLAIDLTNTIDVVNLMASHVEELLDDNEIILTFEVGENFSQTEKNTMLNRMIEIKRMLRTELEYVLSINEIANAQLTTLNTSRERIKTNTVGIHTELDALDAELRVARADRQSTVDTVASLTGEISGLRLQVPIEQGVVSQREVELNDAEDEDKDDAEVRLQLAIDSLAALEQEISEKSAEKNAAERLILQLEDDIQRKEEKRAEMPAGVLSSASQLKGVQQNLAKYDELVSVCVRGTTAFNRVQD